MILSESPIFFLELFEDPPTRRQDPLTFHRTESTSYDEILDYIIEKEIYHYFDDKFKTNAIDEVNRLREAKPPTKDNPVIVLCNLNAHQLKGHHTEKCKGYRIRLATVEETMARYHEEISPEKPEPLGVIDCD